MSFSSFLNQVVNVLSAEWVLDFMPNGGTAVFLRTTWVSLGAYALAIGFKSAITPGSMFVFDLTELRLLIASTLPWFGVIFGGVYLALYNRFATQWAYIAGLHNQMMQASVADPPDKSTSESVLRLWQAGFIEDAEDLHLATKPIFAAVIKGMLENGEIYRNFEAHAPGGKVRLDKLMQKLNFSIDETTRKKWNQPKLHRYKSK